MFQTGFFDGSQFGKNPDERRWTLAGIWEHITDALNESGAVPSALQMIDGTVIRALHPSPGKTLRQHCPEGRAAGAKGTPRQRFWPLKR
jgi:hypothetical protein